MKIPGRDKPLGEVAIYLIEAMLFAGSLGQKPAKSVGKLN